MHRQSPSLGRWLAAVALTIPAVLGFNLYTFVFSGSLVLPIAVYGAATGTGYRRKDAFALGVGSGALVAVAALAGSIYLLVAYALVTAAAIRPSKLRVQGYRAASLLAVLLLSSAWWVAILIPSLVAVTDEAVDRVGLRGGVEAPVAEETTRTQSPAARALTLAGMSCLVLLALPWLSRLGNIDRFDVPSLLGLAGAVAAAVLALGAFRADPIRALAALALSALPILVLGMYFLIVLGGGIQIGN